MKFRITQIHGRCAVCKRHTVRRIHRRKWMKLIPGSKYLQCHECHTLEFVIFNIFSVVFKKKRDKTDNPVVQTGLPY